MHTLLNASDFVRALESGRIERAEAGPIELSPGEFSDVTIDHLRMTGTKMLGLQIERLVSHSVVARGVELRGTRFEGAHMESWDISASLGQAVQWPRARLIDCRVTDTPLTNANLQRAVLTGCHFAMADLNHVRLTEALLADCHFADPRQGGAVLDNTDMTRAVLCRVDLRGANLFRARFQNAILIGVDLSDANLVEADFSGAVLIDVNTDRAEMSPETERTIRSAPSDLNSVIRLLDGHPQIALFAAVALSRLGRTSALGAQGGGTQVDDAVGRLLRLDFPTLVRELQGRGGPPELSRLRVEGSQVYARSNTGNEVRLTEQSESAPARPPGAPPAPLSAPLPSASSGRSADGSSGGGSGGGSGGSSGSAPPARSQPSPRMGGGAQQPPAGFFEGDGGLEID